ncbi:MAG: class I SAM-dependent methyltransferase, partial [Candidatus Phosphoribacter baldrii]
TAGLENVSVRLASAQATGLVDGSVDVAIARLAYFFGPGCEPGLVELTRIMRPGGIGFVIDVDASRSTFGAWFRGSLPDYDPAAVERFWRRQGWVQERLEVAWEMTSRADFEAVVRLEFAPTYAGRILAEDPDRTGVDYALNLWWRRF